MIKYDFLSSQEVCISKVGDVRRNFLDEGGEVWG